MTTATTTPAPPAGRTIRREQHHTAVYDGAGGRSIAAFYGPDRDADAALFVAAPALRDALEALLKDTGDAVFAASGSEARAAGAVLLLAGLIGR